MAEFVPGQCATPLRISLKTPLTLALGSLGRSGGQQALGRVDVCSEGEGRSPVESDSQ